MPIYEYHCTSCGFRKEFLQKITDPVMSVCPKCNQKTFSKMVTAAGFQLKGSGWYATDFKGGAKKKSDDKKPAETKTDTKTDAKPETKSEAAA